MLDLVGNPKDRYSREIAQFQPYLFQSVDLARLRGDNLQLQADIQLLTREIDLYNNGQSKYEENARGSCCIL